MPYWRGRGDDPEAVASLKRRALAALGIGLACGAIGWFQGGWGHPADVWDLSAPAALVGAALLRARAARLTNEVPREVLISGLLAVPYALGAILVVGPVWGWLTLSSSLGSELLSLSESQGQAALLGPSPGVAAATTLVLTVYGIAAAWVLYKRQRAFVAEGEDV